MSNESARAQRFLDAFHRIESLLSDKVAAEERQHVTFSELVRRSGQLTDRQVNRLRDAGDLRNAIVHSPGGWGSDPIATPREDIVEWLENQVLVIEKPPLVHATLRLQPPTVLNFDSDLNEFLALVSGRDYSQAPVRLADGKLALITTNAVARWIASGYQSGEGVALDHVRIDDVLRFSEDGDHLLIVPRTITAVQAVRAFAGSDAGRSPAAIVLTETGRDGQKPIGICARADVAALLTALGV